MPTKTGWDRFEGDDANTAKVKDDIVTAKEFVGQKYVHSEQWGTLKRL